MVRNRVSSRRIIEALTEIAARGHKHPLLTARDRLPRLRLAARERRAPMPPRRTMTFFANFDRRPASSVEMILAFGDNHRRSTRFERRQDVIEDQIIPRRVLSEPRIKFLDCRLLIRMVLASRNSVRRKMTLWSNGRAAACFLASTR